MARYRKKPVVVDAVVFTRDNFEEIIAFTNGAAHSLRLDGKCTCIIPTLEGEHITTEGDYIIRGVQGEFYPCKPDIFKATYESADTVDVAQKTEVEELKEELMVWKQDRFNIFQSIELYDMTRAKVAREIFDEIDKIIHKFADIADKDKNSYGDFIVTNIDFSLAKLKEKYRDTDKK